MYVNRKLSDREYAYISINIVYSSHLGRVNMLQSVEEAREAFFNQQLVYSRLIISQPERR